MLLYMSSLLEAQAEVRVADGHNILNARAFRLSRQAHLEQVLDATALLALQGANVLRSTALHRAQLVQAQPLLGTSTHSAPLTTFADEITMMFQCRSE